LIIFRDKDKIKQAPCLMADKEVWRTNAKLSKAVYKISKFIKKKRI